MDKLQRKLIIHILCYFLERRNWDFEIDSDGEINFIVGNREIFTIGKNIEEIEKILDEVVRW